MDNKTINYYKLKYLILESFYENIIKQKYTIAQAADRCIVDFRDSINEDNINALVIYSAILSSVANYDKGALQNFNSEISNINKLYENADSYSGLDEDEKKSLDQDVKFIKNSI